MDYGLIVDVETTGLNSKQDKIIEIGIVEFGLFESGPKITQIYGGLEDPKESLRPEIEQITGLSDEMLKGQVIDWQKVIQMFQRSSFVIAHNMEFDRGFLMKRKELSGIEIHWACSLKHIDWQARGFKSRGLNYLACDQGFLNPFPHRAVFDCATTFKVIEPYFSELIETSFQKEFLFEATGAPFSTKDILRENGYSWDGSKKVWSKNIFEAAITKEREFLSSKIYQGKSLHTENEVKY